VNGSLDRLEDSITSNREQLAILQEIERDRLLDDIRQEAEQIDDVERLRNMLSDLRGSETARSVDATDEQ
jgi:hypothetical protein